MESLVLFVGGVRSGKTRLAEIWAQAAASQCLMLATCHCRDAEMAARIAAHKEARGESWLCLEEPLEPLGGLQIFLKDYSGFHGALVLDSLGMWIANLMEQNIAPRSILRRCQLLASGLARLDFPCAVVSEECGLGFVPVSSIARKFGDILGKANQLMAKASETVIFASCGLPLVLKGRLPQAFEGNLQ